MPLAARPVGRRVAGCVAGRRLLRHPGAGKSSFYREHFSDTHVRINLDMLKTRARERVLVEACTAARQPFVVDNTSPTAADRARYVVPAAAAGFERVVSYFCAGVSQALAANDARDRQVPVHALVDIARRLEPPLLDEGFVAAFAVRMRAQGGFVVEPWQSISAAS